MEMEAGSPSSRKRKSAVLDPDEAAAAEGHGPEPMAEEQEAPLPAAGEGGENQEPPHPGAVEGGENQEPPHPAAGEGGENQEVPLPAAGEGGEDRISQLPDDVLGDIITLLPTKEGFRTQILASGWRHLWRYAPLNLDHRELCQDRKDLGALMSRILSAHLGPGRRFCAPVHHLHGHGVATADAWLRSPALRNLEELELCNSNVYSPTLPSPMAAFRFSETLCVATIGDCLFPDITAQAIHFPKLKKLGLERVNISESSLHTMIAGCLALECLLIAHGNGFRCVRINSITLRSICVKYFQLEELIIENAPCLERLLQLVSRLHTSVISAPKLETLGPLSLGTRLVLDSAVIQGFCVESQTSVVRTVKILAVYMHKLSLDDVIGLMRCFPCLERLYIQTDGPGEKNLWRSKRKELGSLDIRLKTIVWRYYGGTMSHVEFAKFFVQNARVLELLTFQVDSDDYNDEEYIAQQRQKLELHRRASIGAHFHFTRNNPVRCVRDFRVHDLDLADPFEVKDPFEFHDL